MSEFLLYYSSIIAIVVMTQITGLTIVVKNTNLNSSKRQGFILTFALLIWATLLEFSSQTILAVAPVELILVRKFVKFIELSIAPIILVKCAFNVFSIKDFKKEKLIARIFITLHMVLELLSIPSGFIFGVTEDNVYYHGKFYWIYTLALLIAGAFLFCKLVRFCRYYQNQKIVILPLILAILGIGVLVRLVNNEIRLNWLTTTIAVIYLYVYYSDIAMHIDFLTKMLNQRCYLTELDLLTFPSAIIIFDINDFKCVNDTYGHNYGDNVISLIGGLIKNVFQENGKCFRIGGDEFAVLQTKNLNSVDMLIDELNARLNTQRAKDSRVPSISWGIAYYQYEYQKIKNIIKEADENMYKNKNNMKSKND